MPWPWPVPGSATPSSHRRRLERRRRLGRRVDRVDLHRVHRAQRHQGLAVAVEQVAALAAVRSSLERLAGRQVGVPGRAGRSGSRPPSRRRAATRVTGTAYDHGTSPGSVQVTVERRPWRVSPSRSTSPAVTATVASPRSLTVGRERSPWSRRRRRDGIRGPWRSSPRVGRGGRLRRRVAVGLALTPPQRHRRYPRRAPGRRRRPARCETSWGPVNYGTGSQRSRSRRS